MEIKYSGLRVVWRFVSLDISRDSKWPPKNISKRPGSVTKSVQTIGISAKLTIS